MNFSKQILGSSLLLPAHGRAGARVTPFLAAFFAKRKTKFGGGKALLRLSASDGQARAGKNSLPAGRQASPQPPFLPAPPERSVLVSAARSAAIIRDFAQKRFALRSVIANKKAMAGGGACEPGLPSKILRKFKRVKFRAPRQLGTKSGHGLVLKNKN